MVAYTDDVVMVGQEITIFKVKTTREVSWNHSGGHTGMETQYGSKK